LRDLEAMAQRLVVHERGGIVAAADLERIAREHGWKLAPRIPSRHPRVEDIRDALWSTRMQSGRTNKTRAALWLGWDPDTLVARMADLGIADQVDPQAAWPGEPSSATQGGSAADPEE
jgi:DNA-binding NtrC family response regulator